MLDDNFGKLEQLINQLVQENLRLQQQLSAAQQQQQGLDSQISSLTEQLENAQLELMEKEEQQAIAAKRLESILELFPKAG